GPALPPIPSPAAAAPRPGPPPMAPWPDEHALPSGAGAPQYGGGERFGRALAGGAAPARTNALPPTRSVSPRTEIGQLVENIPRTMRIAVPALIEVRVARADVQALAEGLQGGGAAYQHEVMVTKAMSVRLRAPDGGFYIETASPETQWIEKAMLLSSEDFASWRWHVTPRDKGRRRLQLIISARTVSADGLAAETALPDQVITVRVRTNYAKAARRWIGWGAAAVVGGLLAKFGEGAFVAIGRMLAG
ncbi:MAG: Clp protease, partial [Hyphomicrobium sp.]|nr:Clp protease [Hyphomicrobium sp.]